MPKYIEENNCGRSSITGIDSPAFVFLRLNVYRTNSIGRIVITTNPALEEAVSRQHNKVAEELFVFSSEEVVAH